MKKTIFLLSIIIAFSTSCFQQTDNRVVAIQGKMTQYYQAISQESFNATDYFAPQVEQFITLKNVTPQDITNSVLQASKEFSNPQFNIVTNMRKMVTSDGKVYYKYMVRYRCLRVSMNKNEDCTITVEIGVNAEEQLTSYREMQISTLVFSPVGSAFDTGEVALNKEADNLKRDARAKDVANVFYDTNYTLFDYQTDEPILPEYIGSYTQYQFWFASNENPRPAYERINKKDIEGFKFYKFKTLSSCQTWCNNKNGNVAENQTVSNNQVTVNSSPQSVNVNNNKYDKTTVSNQGYEDEMNSLKGGINPSISEQRDVFDVRFPSGTDADFNTYKGGCQKAFWEWKAAGN